VFGSAVKKAKRQPKEFFPKLIPQKQPAFCSVISKAGIPLLPLLWIPIFLMKLPTNATGKSYCFNLMFSSPPD
jgi:hypothetical protein